MLVATVFIFHLNCTPIILFFDGKNDRNGRSEAIFLITWRVACFAPVFKLNLKISSNILLKFFKKSNFLFCEK